MTSPSPAVQLKILTIYEASITPVLRHCSCMHVGHKAHQCDGVPSILPSLILRDPCLWALLATLTMRAFWASSGSSRLVSRKGPRWLIFSC